MKFNGIFAKIANYVTLPRDPELEIIGRLDQYWSQISKWMSSIKNIFTEKFFVLLSRRLPYQIFMRLPHFENLFPSINLSGRRRNFFSRLNRKMLGFSIEKHSHSHTWICKSRLEALFYLRNKQLIQELENCAQKLTDAIHQAKPAGRPIILAPMHMHSDLLATLVCARAVNGPVAVVTAHDDISAPTEDIEKLRKVGIEIERINPLERDSTRLLTTIRRLRKGEITLISFPDAPPEITHRVFGFSMRTLDTKLFEGAARIHSGIIELSRLSGAHTIFVCLRWTRHGFDIEILNVLAPNELVENLSLTIERSIRRYPDSWLFWHSPSLFSFNSSDRHFDENI
ncbi:hypothetical protein [Pandoraea sp. NPDC090278]|uniref:hypothetical protein n=1 Tax=Pandoraea sp. NPDC090278 TaxID=3364391 RepID=UPI00383BE958